MWPVTVTSFSAVTDVPDREYGEASLARFAWRFCCSMIRRSDGPVSGSRDMSCHLPFGLRPPQTGSPFVIGHGAVDAELVRERDAVLPARPRGRARGAEPGGE